MNVNQIPSSVPQENMAPRLMRLFKVDVKTPPRVRGDETDRQRERDPSTYSTGDPFSLEGHSNKYMFSTFLRFDWRSSSTGI